ncbi:MAG TPA: FKBP-type peptidyl-prolyl cis-trans isomerase [Paludibacter sp.]|nr:FKBP-type peptidyl-prolyl cis-trans isomerase [Paludibacter sp.]
MKNAVLVVLVLVLASCVKQSPQLPANKIENTDNSKHAMLEVNKNLIAREDSLLQEYVSARTGFAKHELGFWYRIDIKGNGPLLKNKDICSFTYKLSLLNGNPVEERQTEAEIGKMTLVKGLEEGLKQARRGESATFVIPWYLGFGMKGNDAGVPPFTSIIYQVRIQK